jgi:hypothetical protein
LLPTLLSILSRGQAFVNDAQLTELPGLVALVGWDLAVDFEFFACYTSLASFRKVSQGLPPLDVPVWWYSSYSKHEDEHDDDSRNENKILVWVCITG